MTSQDMRSSTEFHCFVLAPKGLPNLPLLRAVERAGGTGFLQESGDGFSAAFAQAQKAGIERFGTYVQSVAGLHDILSIEDPKPLAMILNKDVFFGHPEGIRSLKSDGVGIWVEISSASELGNNALDCADGVIIKGHECSGLVSEQTSFVLVQELARRGDLPFMVRGGVTPQTAAASHIAGAAGVVLDDQIVLFPEVGLRDTQLRNRVAKLSGSETIQIELGQGRYFRALSRSNAFKDQTLKSRLQQPDGIETISRGLSWSADDVIPAGQGVALAKASLDRYKTLGRYLAAILQSVDEFPRTAMRQCALAPESAFAREMGVSFPILQGPMTRVSDVPEFFDQVAAGGAVPFAALALLRGDAVGKLLTETKSLLGDKPWGVGLLGFADPEILKPQLDAVAQAKPDFAIVAGGRVNQLNALEAHGTRAFVHVATVPLLNHYLDEGVCRFVIEGRECGGHIGPLSSFVLWSAIIEALRSHATVQKAPKKISVVFAGGVHDALSAAMVATLSAQLAEMGVKTGVLMGTAYLFTEEIVKSGAVVADYQEVALECQGTEALWEGPGFASRCAMTPITDEFQARKQALEQKGVAIPEIREELETYTLGRLRMATKGLARQGKENKLSNVGKARRQREGMYMIGQVAALQDQVQTIEDLHLTVTEGAQDLLEQHKNHHPGMSNDAADAPCDIAIVGMSTLLPGSDTLDTYWRRILSGESAIREVPADRWSMIGYHDDDPTARDKIYATRGGFLDDVAFDPLKYGIPPTSISSVDPMQLLALEVVSDALKDGGYEEATEAKRMRTSVMFGFSGGLGELGSQYATRAELTRLMGDVPEEMLASLPEWTEDSFAGLLPNVAAGRIANRFDFGGTNQTVDAACASSLAALYSGVMELEAGRSDAVVVGGVDTLQSPFGYLCFAKTTALSPRGVCNTFDEKADGIAISEGLAAIVIKRLADAERDGDRIYAVIKGIGASSDGKAKGLTAPLPKGQKRALNRAYGQAGFAPSEVQLFEAHGTGTVAGDSAELETVGGLLIENDAAPASAAIGSVKALVGHTKATAGLAGLIKIAKGLHHRVLPPHSGVSSPNSVFRSDDTALYLSQTPRPWVARPGTARRAGVSAFGFGGTNFHVAVEEYSDLAQARPAPDVGTSVYFAAIAANSDAEMLKKVTTLDAAIARDGISMRLLRQHSSDDGDIRLAFASGSKAELLNVLSKVRTALESQTDLPASVAFSRDPSLRNGGKLAFLFSGQGAQYPGMLRQTSMLSENFLTRLDEAEAVFGETPTAKKLGRSLSQLIFPPDAFLPDDKKKQMAALTATEVAQPALGAIEFGLFEVLREFGLSPAMVAGHSYGEFAALAAADALSFQELIRLSEARGRAIVDNVDPTKPGAMSAVLGSAEQTRNALSGLEGVVIANINSLQQTVIAGAKSDVEKAHDALDRSGLTAVRVPVSQAFHSPLLHAARDQFSAALAEVSWSKPSCDVYSNTRAAPHDFEILTETLSDHLISPVDFVGMIQAMHKDGATVFVEVGPKSILSQRVPEILGEQGAISIALDRQDADVLGLYAGMATLFAEGAALSLDAVFDALAPEPTPREIPRSKTTWLLNGAYARPLDAPRRDIDPPASRPIQHAQAQWIDGQTSQQKGDLEFMEMKPEALFAPPAKHGQSGDPLADYHAMMTEFLRVQENVMLAYLNQGGPTQGQRAIVPPPPANLVPAATPRVTQPQVTAPAIEPTPPSPVAVAADPVPQSGGSEADVSVSGTLSVFIDIIADRTGYPADALDPDQALEADLGVDSIKRMEVLGDLQKTLPDALAASMRDNMDSIVKLPSIREIVESIFSYAPDGVTEAPSNPFDFTGEAKKTVSAVLPRYVQRAKPENADHVPDDLEANAHVVLMGSQRELALQVAEKCRARGVRVDFLPQKILEDPERHSFGTWLETTVDEASKLVLIYLNGVDRDAPSGDLIYQAWRDLHEMSTKNVFSVLQAAQKMLVDGGRFVSVTCTDGSFSRTVANQDAGIFPASGVLGLVKALSLEWPTATLKAVDVDRALPIADQASCVLREITMLPGRREVGYASGTRSIFRTEPFSLCPPDGQVNLPDASWVVVASGGARGITAECLRTLAPFGCTLVLLGRSKMPDPETNETEGLDGAALRKHYFARAKSEGAPVRPTDVEAQVQAHLARRDQVACVSNLKTLGANVAYLPVDVADEAAVTSMAKQVFDRFGRVDMLVHGAGVIEDCAFEKKTRASFDRVFDTKVNSAFLLVQALQNPQLKSICFFSSVAGRYGNPGQADYGAANETLNRYAWSLKRNMNPDVRVKTINWGPWGETTTGAGMVTEAVRAQFLQRGIGMVEAEPGRDFFFKEMFWSDPADVEVVGWVADGETLEEQATALPAKEGVRHAQTLLLNGAVIDAEQENTLRWTLDWTKAPYVDHHRFDGEGVLPFAAAVQMMSELPRAFGYDLKVRAAENVKLLQGIKLVDEPVELIFRLVEVEPGQVFDASIRSTGPVERIHYAARLLCDKSLNSQGVDAVSASGSWGGPPIQEIYESWLSHGPAFQSLVAMDGMGKDTIGGKIAPSNLPDFAPQAVVQPWNFDVGMVDGGLQLFWIWAWHHGLGAALPLGIERIEQFEGADPTSGLSVRVEGMQVSDTGEMSGDIAVFDQLGAQVFRITNFRAQSSHAVARLAGGWAGGKRVPYAMLKVAE